MAPRNPDKGKDTGGTATLEMLTGVPPGSLSREDSVGSSGASSSMATVEVFTGVAPGSQVGGSDGDSPAATVPAGGLEDVLAMTTSGKPSPGETKTLPSGTEWTVGENRSQTIQVPGKGPVLVDDGHGRPSEKSFAGRYESARLGDSAAEFYRVFDRWPTSDEDWTTAVFLNPNSYTEKFDGMGPEIRAILIEPVPGKGVVRATHFIEQYDVYNPFPLRYDPRKFLEGDFSFPEDLGDNRIADPYFDPESGKISVLVDYENGVIIMRQNPSVSGDGNDVAVAAPQATVWQNAEGEVRLKYSGRDGFLPEMGRKTGTVNGDLVLTPSEDGVELGGVRTDYPSFEAYHDTPGGATSTILIDPAASGAKHGPMVNLWFEHELPGGGQEQLDPYRELIINPWGGPAVLMDSPGGVKLGPIDNIPRIRRANGGYVSGPGGPTDDLVAAWLSNGEYVINAESTRQYGALLDAINSGDSARLAEVLFPGSGGSGSAEMPQLDLDGLVSDAAVSGLSGGISGALSGMEQKGLVGGLVGGIKGTASSAGSQIGSGIGAAIGTAVGGPVGTAIGSALGSIVGSEVGGGAAEIITKPIQYVAETAKEVIGSGFGLVDLAEGPGGHTQRGDIYNISGMDPKSVKTAVERVRRRKLVAVSRGGSVR